MRRNDGACWLDHYVGEFGEVPWYTGSRTTKEKFDKMLKGIKQ